MEASRRTDNTAAAEHCTTNVRECSTTQGDSRAATEEFDRNMNELTLMQGFLTVVDDMLLESIVEVRRSILEQEDMCTGQMHELLVPPIVTVY